MIFPEPTFLQLVTNIEQIVDNQLTLEQFVFGERWNINQQENLLYPNFFLEVPSIIEFNQSEEIWSLAYVITDRGKEDLSDIREILSKTKQIAELFLFAYYKCYQQQFNSLTYSMLPFLEAYEDRVHGWRVEFKISLGKNIDLCELPEKLNICDLNAS